MKIQVLAILAVAPALFAQFPGGPPPGPPKPAKDIAPIDLTGYWVSIVSEDWRFRMIAAPKGDFAGVPLNPAGQKVAKEWDPAKDEAAGNQCKAYGAAGLMRIPTRLHITWQDDNTLKIEADAGTQTRLLHFGPPQPPSGPPTLQGYSAARMARIVWWCRLFRSGVRSHQGRLARSEHQPSGARAIFAATEFPIATKPRSRNSTT